MNESESKNIKKSKRRTRMEKRDEKCNQLNNDEDDYDNNNEQQKK